MGEYGGFVWKPFSFSFQIIFLEAATLTKSFPSFCGGEGGWGESCVEDVSNTKSVSSCFCSLLLFFLLSLPMMPTVAGLLLLLELLQVFGFEGS